MTENQPGNPENSNPDDSQDSAGNRPAQSASSTQEGSGSGPAPENTNSSDSDKQNESASSGVEEDKNSNGDKSSNEGGEVPEATDAAISSDDGDQKQEDDGTSAEDRKGSEQLGGGEDDRTAEMTDQGDATQSEAERIQDEEKEQEDKRPLMERVLDKLLNLRERITGEKPDLDVPETFKQDMEKLENLTKELEEDNKKQHEHLLRLSAEFENFKKRTANNIQMEKERAQQQAIGGLFPVMDSLEMSINFEPDPAKAEQLMGTMQEGLKLVSKQMESFLVSIGLTPIDALGQDFDPELHEALEATGDGTTYKVMEEIQRGFMQKGRVIRPAKVKVQAMPQKEDTDLDLTDQAKAEKEAKDESGDTSSQTPDNKARDETGTSDAATPEASTIAETSDEQAEKGDASSSTNYSEEGSDTTVESAQIPEEKANRGEASSESPGEPPEPEQAHEDEEEIGKTGFVGGNGSDDEAGGDNDTTTKNGDLDNSSDPQNESKK